MAHVTALVKVHAKLAPSKAHRWLGDGDEAGCPGSVHVVAEDPETEWAAEGTRKHAVLEYMQRPDAQPLAAGDEIDTPAGRYKVPKKVIEQCAAIMEYVAQFKETNPNWVVERETRVEVGSRVWAGFKPGDCAGTADVAAYCYTELLVLDAKFGFVKKYPRGNAQLYLYALGLLEEIPYPVEHVTVCIAQPMWDDEVEFREHRLSAQELREWALSKQAQVEEIQAGSYRLRPSETACRYCPARTQCQARLEMFERVQDQFWFQEIDLAEAMRVIPQVRQICKDIEQRVAGELNAGKDVVGCKLVAASSKRAWPIGETGEVDEQAIVASLGDVLSMAIAKDDLKLKAPVQPFDQKLKTPAKMEKEVRAALGCTVKKARALVDEVAIKPQGKPKVVMASDPRPALAAGGFTLEDVLKLSLEETEFGEE